MIKKEFFFEARKRFGTPTFLYDFSKMEEQYIRIRKNLSSSCHIFYSMKANPLLGIVEYFNALGSGCEVASQYELLTALQAGFFPGDIIFVGPAKKEEELTLAIQKNIKAIVCESILECEQIDCIAKKHHRTASVMLRINPDFNVKNSPIKMSGVASQFGIDLSQIENDFLRIKSMKNIVIDGIHIYNASRVLDVDAIAENIQNILALAHKLSIQFDFQWKTIDVGGGFGVPYFDSEVSLDENKLLFKINDCIESYKKEHPETEFIIELGRYLVAESGYLLGSIISVKENHQKNYAISDAGMHCHLAVTGLGSFIHRNFPASILSKSKTKTGLNQNYQVSGPLCTPSDILLKEFKSHHIEAGDLLVINQVGAYGPTASPSRFLSHGSPAEVILYKEQLYLARKRETIKDILSNQNDFTPIFKIKETIHENRNTSEKSISRNIAA